MDISDRVRDHRVTPKETAETLYYGASGLSWAMKAPSQRAKRADMQFVPIVGPREREQTLALLAEGFAHANVVWPQIFEAPAGESGHGLLLVADGTAQGVILSFERAEIIGERRRRIVNLSSWYVRPNYRRFAVRMVREASADADAIYVTCSPIWSAQKIALRTGWRYLSHGSIASIPLINGVVSQGGSAVEPYVKGALSNPDHARWMADHGDDRHIGLVVRTGASTVPSLWLRSEKARLFGAARLLFTSDYGVLRSALPAVHGHMMRRHRITRLSLPRVGALASLRSVRGLHSGPSLMVKGEIDPEDVNLLYSEFLYLRGRWQ